MRRSTTVRRESHVNQVVDNRTAVIMRVSSKEQENGYSLGAQERYFGDWINRIGLTAARLYPIAETASKEEERQKFNAALSEIEELGIPNLVFEKVDRSTRNFHDAGRLERWVKADGRRVIYFMKESFRIHKDSPPSDWMMFGMQVTAAKTQAETIRREVLKGMIEKLRQGWWPGRPMIGYVNVRGPNKKPIQVIDQERSSHVRQLFELIDSGNYSVPRALQRVTREGLRSPEGRQLTPSHAYYVLTDPFYIGEMHWGGEVYQGAYERFIESDLFDRVQQRLKRPSTAKYGKHDFMFKGLLECAECQRVTSWYNQKGHVYGECKQRTCPIRETAREDRIDAELLTRLASLAVPSPTWADWIRENLVRDTEDTEQRDREQAARVGAIHAQVERIKGKLDRLYDDRLDQRIAVELYDRKEKELRAEIAGLESALATEQQSREDPATKRLLFWDASQAAVSRYAAARDFDTKRNLLREVFSNLRLRGNVLLAELNAGAKLLAEAVADYLTLKQQFEPQKSASQQGETLCDAQCYRLWYTLLDSLRAIDPPCTDTSTSGSNIPTPGSETGTGTQLEKNKPSHAG